MDTKITRKDIDNFYFSRFIDSLEKDEWHFEDHQEYSAYYSPEYTNKEGIKLSFKINKDYGWYSARIGHHTQWYIPNTFLYNMFSYRTRRFHKAMKKMIKEIKNKEEQERNEFLFKAL